ncbi:hypothetical protein [Streptomyces sp. MI02-7b]|uniref:hypothetical protein n=1 Tax=Streptomyces sp. MI02-7b TaxID=462941 RepID=UPI0029B35F95|nr:hypothetical protein [Streptomyces sp. MI02-7b]MDX3075446.1 hypothetical protein [Streptomyces sp. MI02-7b]
MTKKRSSVPPGKATSRFEGDDQHGWSPDVDATHQEENPSAHRSFHPDTYAPGGKNREPSQQDIEDSLEGTPVEGVSRSGEERSGKSGKKGIQDMGPRGRSGRPSGGKDVSESTAVDPQEPSGGPSSRGTRERNP